MRKVAYFRSASVYQVYHISIYQRLHADKIFAKAADNALRYFDHIPKPCDSQNSWCCYASGTYPTIVTAA